MILFTDNREPHQIKTNQAKKTKLASCPELGSAQPQLVFLLTIHLITPKVHKVNEKPKDSCGSSGPPDISRIQISGSEKVKSSKMFEISFVVLLTGIFHTLYSHGLAGVTQTLRYNKQGKLQQHFVTNKDQYISWAKIAKGSHQKRKTTKLWTLSKKGEGGQRRSQTFYRKKVWTCDWWWWGSSSKIVFYKKVRFLEL